MKNIKMNLNNSSYQINALYQINISDQINTSNINYFKINTSKINTSKINTSKINTYEKDIIYGKDVFGKEISFSDIKNTINTFNKNRVYHIHNIYGLGDSVFNFILFYQIKNYIEDNNIKIFYYTKKEYLHQLKEFICSPNIFLSFLEMKPPNSIELWINNGFFEYRHDRQNMPVCFNLYYNKFFNNVIKKLNFNLTLDKILYYYDNDLLIRYDNLPDKYKNFDIMILNSTPFSQQYEYKKDIWDNYIMKLNNHFKILTTTKVDGVLCTFDDNLSIKDIASLSTKAKVIIAINSGVMPGLLNYYTLTTVKHFYIFDNNCYYSYPNFENKKYITDITIEELTKYIS